MPGPPKTPTKRLAPDSWRRKARAQEPEPDRTLPEIPARLNDEERVVWSQVIHDLDGMSIGKEPDARILERYCSIFVSWWKAKRHLDKYGNTYEIASKTGGVYVAVRPEVALVNKWGTELRRIEQEFGMTPAARARIQVENATAKPKAKAFVSRIVG